MNIDKKALKGVIEEVEASRLRQKAEAELQREAIKAAAKNHQLDAKAIRIVLQRRAMGDAKRDEQDYYVHAYEHALGGKKAAVEALEQGASIRQAAKAGGISTGAAAALAKGVQESSKLNTPHDPITGELHEGANRGRDHAVLAEDAPGDSGDASAASIAAQLRAQIPASTDPERLEREARAREQVTTARTACVDGSDCLDVRCNLEGCRLEALRQIDTTHSGIQDDAERESEVGIPTATESCGGVESRHAGGISGEVTIGSMPGGRPSGSSTEQVAAGQTPAGVAPGPHDADVAFVRSQIADLERIFDQTGEEDVLTRLSLGERISDLKDELAKAGEVPTTRSVGAVARPSSDGRVATPFMGDDPGPPPDFLKRPARTMERAT